MVRFKIIIEGFTANSAFDSFIERLAVKDNSIADEIICCRPVIEC